MYVNLDQLGEVKEQLDAIIDEFERAASNSDALERAIGSPFDRDALKNAANDFEGRWDLSRAQLKDDLSGVRDHVDAVIQGVTEADAEMAIGLEAEE